MLQATIKSLQLGLTASITHNKIRIESLKLKNTHRATLVFVSGPYVLIVRLA